MYRIIYLSSAVELFSDEEINGLLTLSREKNLKYNITGLLLYSEGNFMQIIEGEKDDIQNLYGNIKKDLRHKNIITVINEPITKRTFSDWKMGFSIIDPIFLKKHPEINPFLSNKSTNTERIANIFIETFLKSFKNNVLYS